MDSDSDMLNDKINWLTTGKVALPLKRNVGCAHATMVQCLRPTVSKLPHLPDTAGVGSVLTGTTCFANPRPAAKHKHSTQRIKQQ